MPQRVIVEPFTVTGHTGQANFEPHPKGDLAVALQDGWVIVSHSSSAVLHPDGVGRVYGTFVLEKATEPKPRQASF